MKSKKFKVWITERFSAEEEFTGTREELEEFLSNYEVNISSAEYDFSYDILEEKEV